MTSVNDLDQGGLYRPLRRVYRSPTLGWLYDIGDQQILENDVNYFVSKTGNDNNDGLSSGGAFKTIQQLLNTVAAFNFNGHYITGNVGPGTYNEDLSLLAPLVGCPSFGFTLIGDETTPSNVIISSSSTCFQCFSPGSSLTISGFKFVCPAGNAIFVYAGTVDVEANEYGDCTGGYHLLAAPAGAYSGSIVWQGTKSRIISGNAVAHIAGFAASIGGSAAHTVNLIGTPHFSDSYAVAEGTRLDLENITFVGPASGRKFRADYFSSIVPTLGSNLNYLPGDQPGILDDSSSYNFFMDITSKNLGTISSGTITALDISNTIAPLVRRWYYTNNGAHTFPAPLIDGTLKVLITNGASAGAITFTGFTNKATPGDALTTTNGQKFLIVIDTIGGVSTRWQYALQ